jgi:hypothetical protein
VTEELPMFGSKRWANALLVMGIKTLRDLERPRGSVSQEVLFQIGLLYEQGFWWQAKILRSHYHVYLHRLRLQGRPMTEGKGGPS